MNYRDFNQMQFDQLMKFQNNQWEQFKQFSDTQTEQFNKQVNTERPQSCRKSEIHKRKSAPISLEDIMTHSLRRSGQHPPQYNHHASQYKDVPIEVKPRSECRRNVAPSTRAHRNVTNSPSSTPHTSNPFVNNCISNILHQLQAQAHTNNNNGTYKSHPHKNNNNSNNNEKKFELNEFLSKILEQNVPTSCAASSAARSMPAATKMNKQHCEQRATCSRPVPPTRPDVEQPKQTTQPKAVDKKELSVEEKASLALDAISSEFESIVHSAYSNVQKDHRLTQLLLKIDAIECGESTRPVRKLLVRNINTVLDSLSAPSPALVPASSPVVDDTKSVCDVDEILRPSECALNNEIQNVNNDNVNDDSSNDEDRQAADTSMMNETAVHTSTQDINNISADHTAETENSATEDTTTANVSANDTANATATINITTTPGEPETHTSMSVDSMTPGAPDSDSTTVEDANSNTTTNAITTTTPGEPDNTVDAVTSIGDPDSTPAVENMSDVHTDTVDNTAFGATVESGDNVATSENNQSIGTDEEVIIEAVDPDSDD